MIEDKALRLWRRRCGSEEDEDVEVFEVVIVVSCSLMMDYDFCLLNPKAGFK